MKTSILLAGAVIWALIVCSAEASGQTLETTIANATVAADGSGQYHSIQQAIDAAPQRAGNDRWIIHIKPGEYNECAYIGRGQRAITLVGDDAEKTTITYNITANMTDDYGQRLGTMNAWVVFIAADDVSCENISIVNSAGRAGQALAVRLDGDRLIFRNCRFSGYQDTLLGNKGRHYFEGCYITGVVDFIFGAATQFYENCHLHSRGTGMITAASTPQAQPFGFVFNNCRVTAEPAEARIALGRPWRPYASVTFLNTEMCANVAPAGWNNWNSPDREKTARYAEFNSKGPGGDTKSRAPWSRQLTAEQAAEFAKEKVLAGSDGWKP